MQVESSDLDVIGAQLLVDEMQPSYSIGPHADQDDPELAGMDLGQQLSEGLLEDVDFEDLEVV